MSTKNESMSAAHAACLAAQNYDALFAFIAAEKPHSPWITKANLLMCDVADVLDEAAEFGGGKGTSGTLGTGIMHTPALHTLTVSAEIAYAGDNVRLYTTTPGLSLLGIIPNLTVGDSLEIALHNIGTQSITLAHNSALTVGAEIICTSGAAHIMEPGKILWLIREDIAPPDWPVTLVGWRLDNGGQ